MCKSTENLTLFHQFNPLFLQRPWSLWSRHWDLFIIVSPALVQYLNRTLLLLGSVLLICFELGERRRISRGRMENFNVLSILWLVLHGIYLYVPVNITHFLRKVVHGSFNLPTFRKNYHIFLTDLSFYSLIHT